jgi:hypothetical protein
MLNVTQALLWVARTEFVPFTDTDWQAWAGCESENPLIGYTPDYIIIIDGETIFVQSNEEPSDFINFSVKES